MPRHTSSSDFYISAARAWIDGPGHRTFLLNLNLRNSEANQLGLLGFGGDQGGREWQLELAAALFLDQRLAVGLEYRQKPDNLSALVEDDWTDVFIAYFPSNSVSITAAYLQLGEIAGAKNQSGYYISLQASF